MNSCQKLWWDQARSDHDIFVRSRIQGFAVCHSLHYLQMATEKLAKAYLWRLRKAPQKTHKGFFHFLRFLGSVRNERDRIATLYGFRRFEAFQASIYSILPIAYQLEHLAPDLANDGPNTEYPWPHSEPVFSPVNYAFPLWDQLNTAHGRNLIRFIKTAVEHFPEYADV